MKEMVGPLKKYHKCYSRAAGAACAPGLGKTTITQQRAAAAAAAFHFAKSREDRGLAGLTPYSTEL